MNPNTILKLPCAAGNKTNATASKINSYSFKNNNAFELSIHLKTEKPVEECFTDNYNVSATSIFW